MAFDGFVVISGFGCISGFHIRQQLCICLFCRFGGFACSKGNGLCFYRHAKLVLQCVCRNGQGVGLPFCPADVGLDEKLVQIDGFPDGLKITDRIRYRNTDIFAACCKCLIKVQRPDTVDAVCFSQERCFFYDFQTKMYSHRNAAVSLCQITQLIFVIKACAVELAISRLEEGIIIQQEYLLCVFHFKHFPIIVVMLGTSCSALSVLVAAYAARIRIHLSCFVDIKMHVSIGNVQNTLFAQARNHSIGLNNRRGAVSSCIPIHIHYASCIFCNWVNRPQSPFCVQNISITGMYTACDNNFFRKFSIQIDLGQLTGRQGFTPTPNRTIFFHKIEAIPTGAIAAAERTCNLLYIGHGLFIEENSINRCISIQFSDCSCTIII